MLAGRLQVPRIEYVVVQVKEPIADDSRNLRGGECRLKGQDIGAGCPAGASDAEGAARQEYTAQGTPQPLVGKQRYEAQGPAFDRAVDTSRRRRKHRKKRTFVQAKLLGEHEAREEPQPPSLRARH